ncbi:hypothetical protein K493DRAFT_314520 [Basidiobolus meristosporus CBS 931.73]|uniref:Uncharacterized protein n=1 Tax=Basidiobolus meristosporus CBS 931.73 TaxID=1314790 RepID=A0A1Y1YEM2_9FUNG|nr:hypothetical protein K493DRAFT_314520 [Basidiobolus meristosporus CBS 931.73]|eukprot:ORX96457.1 hypothetical protein K493DRAFT_314520 [Basidiobolus meristosporus CBS 931.73]
MKAEHEFYIEQVFDYQSHLLGYLLSYAGGVLSIALCHKQSAELFFFGGICKHVKYILRLDRMVELFLPKEIIGFRQRIPI